MHFVNTWKRKFAGLQIYMELAKPPNVAWAHNNIIWTWIFLLKNLIERPKVVPNKPRAGSSLTTVPLRRSVACPLQNLGEEKNSFECFSCTFHHQGVNSILNKTFFWMNLKAIWKQDIWWNCYLKIGVSILLKPVTILNK